MGLLGQLAAALGDRYRVEREIAQGGMAVVFLAEDLKHHRRVAIKLLKPELSAVLGVERFAREIEIAASLQHPHILPLYDSGAAGGLLYYVMPFVEGESLRQRLAREQQISLDAAYQITNEVGSALQYAHERGVIHRDIKPENIMLSDGHAVVADFGIARAVYDAGATQLTQSGMVMGTPQYMSPEQSSGVGVDGRTDQYSLACAVYEMLIGQPPFSGPSAQIVIARHMFEPVPSLRMIRQTIAPSVEGAIMRAMSKVPADRFDSIQQFMDALASPENATAQATEPAGNRPGSRGRRRLVAALAAGVVVAAAAWWFVAGRAGHGTHPDSRTVTSVAVLPFQDLADSSDVSYLGNGMTAGLIAELAQIGSLKVISGASGSMAKDKARSLADLARELGIDGVVKGSLRRAGDIVSVNVQFFHVPDSTLLFTKDYQSRLGELPDLQREITVAITGAINAELKSTERSRLHVRGEVNQRAYEAYLRGRFNLERGELEEARSMFEQARQIAPDWAPPLVGLANYYTALPFSSDIVPAEVLPKARAALAQALALDETLAEAHAANGYIRAYYEWDWRAAEQEFKRALELRPNYADAHISYSRFLASRGRLDEAVAQLNRAVELDPMSLELPANGALLQYFAGRYDEASTRLHEVLKRDSTDTMAEWGLALVAEQQGRPREAVSILELLGPGGLNRKASLGHAYAVAGDSVQARKILTELQADAAKKYVPSYYFALVHAGLGERGPALRYLERAYEERSTVLAYLLVDPRLAPLRDEPRFLALAKRLKG
jgi:serine/threonine-protein kinase